MRHPGVMRRLPPRRAAYNRAMPLVLIQCACPDAAGADAIARTLVDERLAACVQVLPGLRSTYRWQGAVEQADEVLLQAKTTHRAMAAAMARIAALHPYEVPEVIALQALHASDAYAAWVGAQVDA